MPSISSRWIVSLIAVCYLIMHINAAVQGTNQSKTSGGIETESPPKPPHNDTSLDNQGANYDSEPFQNNGRGSHEANSQNYAAETNGTHGMPIDEFQQIILVEHNKYRRQMCANGIQDDDALHEKAIKLAHDRANGVASSFPDDCNENIFELDTGDPSKITGEMIVKAWYDEHNNYDIKNEASAKNFTQLVWKNSKKLGIGHAYDGHKLFIVALYKPPGNIPGQFASNVGCGSYDRQKQANR